MLFFLFLIFMGKHSKHEHSGLGLVGYDDCLTRSRSRVQSSELVFFSQFLFGKQFWVNGLVAWFSLWVREVVGSIPTWPLIFYFLVIQHIWGYSSIGRVRALQARGTGIETRYLQIIVNLSSISLVVRTPRCGRGNPGSNPGWSIAQSAAGLV